MESRKKIGIIGGGSIVGSSVGMLMALAGSALPILTKPQRLHPPKNYPDNVRHQGAKEMARRMRQMGESNQ